LLLLISCVNVLNRTLNSVGSSWILAWSSKIKQWNRF
jgi:hypothetical protein